MPSDSKNGPSVSALLRSLNAEIGRKKGQKRDDRLLLKTHGSVRCGLDRCLCDQDAQDTQSRAGRDLCGAIFMCNRRTWKECLGQSLFGLPSGKKSLVDQVAPGMKLFLFEYERRQLWGVFEALSYGAMDIIPNAYTGGSFPCQVRVKVPEDCVALNEEEFYHPLKDNYYCSGKFHFDLTGKQVCHLTSLFEKKYLRTSGVEPALLDFEYRRAIAGQMLPLLLTNGEASENWERDHSPHNLQAWKPQLGEEGSISNFKERVGIVYRTRTNFKSEMSWTSMGTRMPAMAQSKHSLLNVDAAPSKDIERKLGKGIVSLTASSQMQCNSHSCVAGEFGSGELVPVIGTLKKQEMIETLVIPNHSSQCHSDRLNRKSVWTRISGSVKPFSGKGTSNKQEKIVSNGMDPMSLKQPVETSVNKDNISDMQEVCTGDVIEMAVDHAEEVSVMFKRRRGMGKSDQVNVSEAHSSKRRRKLRRPAFENQDALNQLTNLDLNVPFAPDIVDSDQQSECIKDNVSSDRSEQCCSALALSLHQQSEAFLPRPKQEVEVTSHEKTDNQEKRLCLNEARIDFVDLSQQVEMPRESSEHRKVQSAKEQSFGILGHTPTDCVALESMSLNGGRASPLNEASCTPAIVSAACSGLPVQSEASINSVDLKTILNGLQVSGIKLQLGPSPCLILQLGDSKPRISDEDKP